MVVFQTEDGQGSEAAHWLVDIFAQNVRGGLSELSIGAYDGDLGVGSERGNGGQSRRGECSENERKSRMMSVNR